MHRKGVIHRDLKTNNVLIRKKDNKLFWIGEHENYNYFFLILLNPNSNNFADFNLAVTADNLTNRISGTDIMLSGDCIEIYNWDGSELRNHDKTNVHQQNEVDDLFTLYNVIRQLNNYNGKTIHDEFLTIYEPVEKVRSNQTYFEVIYCT